jgi:hypothetical protein
MREPCHSVPSIATVGSIHVAAYVEELGCHSGSVSTRASKDSLCPRTCSDASLCGFQDGQHHHTLPEVKQSASVGGHVLVVTGSEAEEVAQFIVSPAEPSS